MKKALLILSLICLATSSLAVNVEKLNSSLLDHALFVQQKEFPVVSLLLSFNAGSIHEGEYPHGTANLVSRLLNKGTEQYTAAQIQKRLESVASYISISSNRDSLNIEVKTLEQNLDKTLDILQDIITNPIFPEREISIAKAAVKQDVRQELELPSAVAGMRAKKIFYGSENEKLFISTLGTEQSIDSISRQQLKSFAKKLLTKNNMRLSVISSMPNKETSEIIDNNFKTIPDGFKKETNKIKIFRTPSNIIVEKDLPQTFILMFNKGISVDDPNYYKSVIFNYILGGGGFSSRLMKELREKRGLTYGVRSSFDYDTEIPSMFTISMETANETAHKSEQLIRQELTKVENKGFTKKELSDAKSFLTGSFPIRLRTSSKMLGYLDIIQKFNLPLNYMDKWDDNIDKVSLEELNSYAEGYLKTHNIFSRVFVGGVK